MLVQSDRERRFELHWRTPCRQGRNPIVHAAKVIGLLEEWFAEYTEKALPDWWRRRDRSTRFKWVGPHKPAFVPAACHFYVDLENKSAGKSRGSEAPVWCSHRTDRQGESGPVVGSGK